MSENNQHTDILGFSHKAFLGLFITIILMALWIAKPEIMVTPWMKYSQLKIMVVEYFSSHFWDSLHQEAMNYSAWLSNQNPKHVTSKDFMLVNIFAYTHIGIVFSCITVLMMIKPMVRKKYNKKHDMESLIQQEMHTFTHLLPLAFTDPNSEKDINKGVFAVRQSPSYFIKVNKLRLRDGSLNTKKTQQVLIKQLGSRFEGVKSMSDIEIFFLAIYGVHINKNSALEDEMVRSMNYAFSSSKGLDTKKGLKKLANLRGKHEEIFANCYAEGSHNAKVIIALLKKHAYTRTVIQGFMTAAKKEGIITHTSFPWLIAVDRTLNFVIVDGLMAHNGKIILRPASAEQAGVRSHFIAEYRIDRAIVTPYIQSAIEGLSEHVKL